MVRVRDAGVNRADFGAFGRIVMAHALNTLVKVNYIGCFTLADGADGALGLAGSTADTLVCNFIRHSIYLLNLS
jgi:hypothetical protein